MVVVPYSFEIIADSIVLSLNNVHYGRSIVEKYATAEASTVITAPLNDTDFFYEMGRFECSCMMCAI